MDISDSEETKYIIQVWCGMQTYLKKIFYRLEKNKQVRGKEKKNKIKSK